MMAMLPNGGCLNRGFEQMGVPYATRPLLGTKASQAAMKKQKAESVKKTDYEEGEGCSW
jgi:hypothetical protein